MGRILPRRREGSRGAPRRREGWGNVKCGMLNEDASVWWRRWKLQGIARSPLSQNDTKKETLTTPSLIPHSTFFQFSVISVAEAVFCHGDMKVQGFSVHQREEKCRHLPSKTSNNYLDCSSLNVVVDEVAGRSEGIGKENSPICMIAGHSFAREGD